MMPVRNVFEIERPLIMAHRGDPSAAPENTLLAMEKAVEVGADVLETDVRLTKDNRLVLFHDETLDRTTNKTGRVQDYTLAELEEIDLGWSFTPDGGETHPFRGQGQTVVTLEEALERFREVWMNLDIKNLEPVAAERLTERLRDYDRQDTVTVASFHPEQLERFRNLAPTVITSAHPGEVKRFVIGLKSRLLPLLVRNPEYRAFQVPIRQGGTEIVNKRFIQEAHKRGIYVHVWTINDRETMEWLIDIDVDGIFTDNPVLLREVLKDAGLLD
ncbi:glycerophosphodiester phosphodiesterase [Candidatus Thorarchaeota archaeon]|nr:MAG: glycerophosphodiester phosphodiesterase [Candidatus Thorarchaeota archaeon]